MYLLRQRNAHRNQGDPLILKGALELNKFLSVLFALVFAAVSFWGLGKAHFYIEALCLVHTSERSDSDILQSEYVVFGTAADFLPMAYINHEFDGSDSRYITSLITDNEQYSSEIDMIYAQTVAKAIGLKLRIAYVPRNELISALESGKVDFISSFGLNKTDLSKFRESNTYYRLKPVLVFGESAPKSLKNVESIRCFGDNLLSEKVDKSSVPNASWQSVSTYYNLINGIDKENAYLTEISCVAENTAYKSIEVSDKEEMNCRFVCRAENEALADTINSAILRLEESNQDFYIQQQFDTIITENSNNESDGFMIEDVYSAFSTNNFSNGTYSFPGTDNTFFAVSQNKLYHYSSDATLIKVYDGFIVGRSLAVGSSVFTIDSDDKNVCRVLDLNSGNIESISIKTKLFWFKRNSLRKAHRLLKDRKGVISYDNFIELLTLKASGDIKYLDENYIWKNYIGTFANHLIRYNRSFGTTKMHTNFISLLGKDSFRYNVYNEYGYYIKDNSMYSYEFSGEPKKIATEEKLINPISYILDKGGDFYIICNMENKYKIFRWRINGFCDEIFETDKPLNNVYDAGNYIIAYYGEAFLILDKLSGNIAEKMEVS